MATMATTIAAVRRILGDRPVEDALGGAIAAGSTTTMTPTDVTQYARGNVWEFQDGATEADVVLVTGVDAETPAITIRRNHENSTGIAHSSGAILFKDPTYRYNTIAQAVNTVIESDLFEEQVWDLLEHQVTSNADGSADYNAPTSLCEEFLAVYQQTSAMTSPYWFGAREFSQYPRNVDTSLYANGKVFFIRRNLGVLGTDIYYVTCKHRLTLATLTATQERIVQWLTCAYLLEWQESRRLGGPTNQGDRTVRPGQAPATAAYYRQLAQRALQAEQSRLRKLNPPTKVWRRA